MPSSLQVIKIQLDEEAKRNHRGLGVNGAENAAKIIVPKPSELKKKDIKKWPKGHFLNHDSENLSTVPVLSLET